jgi:hypothetical protein
MMFILSGIFLGLSLFLLFGIGHHPYMDGGDFDFDPEGDDYDCFEDETD